LSIGVKAGVPFTDDFNSDTFTALPQVFRSYSNSTGYIIGPMGEIHLPLGFSVEADALYRPLDLRVDLVGDGHVSDHTYTSWEFPILAKWRLPIPLLKPYVELGPSFRALGGTASNYLSNDGFTFGGGIELHIARVRVGPELRYTHWGSDSPSAAAHGFISNQDQGEFLVGFSF
jgi:hypothetical protein